MLQFPLFAMVLEGLSPRQVEHLEENFLAFLVDDVRSDTPVIRCSVVARQNPPKRAPLVFAIDGHYVPWRTWRGDCLDIEGHQFLARVGFGALAERMQLSVDEEGDLGLLDVLENCLRIVTAYRALERGGLVLHSAGLVVDGRAWLFCGRSNAGKTTLSRKAASRGARVLSDDLNLLLPDSAGYSAHAVPFTGEYGRTLDQPSGLASFPVAGIVCLEQGSELAVSPISPAHGVARLVVCSPFVNSDQALVDSMLDCHSHLTSRLPFYRLVSRREDGFDEVYSLLQDQSAVGEVA